MKDVYLQYSLSMLTYENILKLSRIYLLLIFLAIDLISICQFLLWLFPNYILLYIYQIANLYIVLDIADGALNSQVGNIQYYNLLNTYFIYFSVI